MPPAPDAEPAPAKINLYLHVLGRRADGYHTLDSLAVFAGAADRLTAAPADRLTAAPADSLALAVTGPFAAALDGHPNLVLRAATALAEAAGIHAGARLTLEKTLPVASGIGGGSADAAATLRLLARVWRLAPDPAALPAIAASLGADVPVCLAGRPARMAGIGDVLAPAPALPPFGIALLNPGITVPTGPVFAARTGPFSAPATLPAAWPDATAMADDLRTLANDLEAPACALHPAIPQALAALAAQRGCLLARMSGSGATCFALFATPALAATAAARAARPGWWAWGGGAYEAPV